MGGPPRRDYIVTCVPGLEDVTAEEVRELLDGEVVSARRGKVRLLADTDPSSLAALRSVDHVHVRLGEFTLGPDDEASFREALAGTDLEPYLDAMAAEGRLPPSPTFRITAQREGRHSFSSEDVGRWAGSVVEERTGWRVDLEGHDLEIVLRVEDEEAWVAGRLSRTAGRKRPWIVRHHPAALNPLIAHGMVRLAAPLAGERVLDPFCGSGTLLIEGALGRPGAMWAGSDLHPRDAAAVRENAAAAGVRVRTFRADARRLPIRDGALDLVLSNLPYGRRSGTHSRNRRLYGAFFRELARVLRPGGRAMIITLERRLVEDVLARVPLEQVSLRRVNHGGLEPVIRHLRHP